MIAQNIHGPGNSRPGFSPAAAEQLATAIREFVEDSPASAAVLQAALSVAAADARSQNLGPEQVVLALKAIQNEVGERLGRTGRPASVFRRWYCAEC
jgi:hypothetical protein